MNCMPGEVICIESGMSHSIEAHEDSALLVLFHWQVRTPQPKIRGT